MKTYLFLALLSPLSALASTAEDVELIRGLLAPGTDVAQIQAEVLRGTTPQQALEAGAKNYLIRDLNGDGLVDVLVVAEENPGLIDYSGEQPRPCEKLEGSCMVEYKKRSLALFLGTPDGYNHAFTNDHMVRSGDEGGVFGDPLEGFDVRKSGAVALSYYGGSAWRWSFTDVMQFRRGQFYVIGQDSSQSWTGDMRSHTKSVNLINGRVVETDQAGEDAPLRTRRYRIPVRPLVLVSQYSGQE